MSFDLGKPTNRKVDRHNDVSDFYYKTMNKPYPPWAHKPWEELPQASKEYWEKRYEMSRNGQK